MLLQVPKYFYYQMLGFFNHGSDLPQCDICQSRVTNCFTLSTIICRSSAHWAVRCSLIKHIHNLSLLIEDKNVNPELQGSGAAAGGRNSPGAGDQTHAIRCFLYYFLPASETIGMNKIVLGGDPSAADVTIQQARRSARGGPNPHDRVIGEKWICPDVSGMELRFGKKSEMAY
jgi:hypothetical protein